MGLRSNVDPDVPARLVGDAGRLRQVITNVLDNAIKLTADGAVCLTATVARTTEWGPGLGPTIDLESSDGGGVPS